jgi:hypothetical protein
VPDPVGEQQRGQRRAPLRQPACVFHGRGRRLYGGQVDRRPHYLQAGVDVAVDAGDEQGEDGPVVAKLRNFADDRVVDVVVQRGGAAGHRRRDVAA